MNKVLYKRPRHVLMMWAMFLAAGALFLSSTDVAMRAYAEKRNATDYHYYTDRAAQLLEANNIEGARAQISQAIQLAPEASQPQMMLGHLQYRLRNWDKAIEAYRRAIELGNRDEGVRQNIVWSYIELEKFDDAVAFGKAAIAEGYRGEVLPRFVAEAYFRNKQFDAAIEVFEAALKQHPKDIYVLERLGRCYDGIGNRERAEVMSNKIAEIQSTAGGA